MDNQNLMIDRTGGRYQGRVYLRGNVSGDPFWLTYSTDSGRSFVRGEVTHVEGSKWSQFDRGTILLDGTVLLPYKTSDKRNPDTPDAPKTTTYGVSRSIDGGVHMARPDTVARARADRSAKLRFSASLDGGDTWLPSVAVSKLYAVDGPRGLSVHATVVGGGREPDSGRGGGAGRGAQPPTDMIQTPLGPGARQTLGFMAGDYSTLLANPNGALHAFWVDNRGDVTKPTQLYTTTVTVAGSVQRNGAADLAALDNVTRRVEVQYRSANSNWEGDYLNVSLGVVLVNVSRDTIVGPLKYRILGVHSPLGAVIVRGVTQASR